MGLIKAGMKAAVAVKVGHVVHDRIQRRQQTEWDSQAGLPVPPQAAAASPAQAAGSDMLAQLAQLGELRTAGVLTDAEFEAQKARILNG